MLVCVWLCVLSVRPSKFVFIIDLQSPYHHRSECPMNWLEYMATGLTLSLAPLVRYIVQYAIALALLFSLFVRFFSLLSVLNSFKKSNAFEMKTQQHKCTSRASASARMKNLGMEI